MVDTTSWPLNEVQHKADSAVLNRTGYGDQVTTTRANNTTAYTANDVVGGDGTETAAVEFANVAGAGGGDVLITSVALEIDITAVPSGMTSFRLYLYSETPPSAYADNAAWDLPAGDRASYLGYVDVGTPVDLGSTLYVETNQINKQVTATGTSLFGYLVTNAGWTPAAQSVLRATLHTVAL